MISALAQSAPDFLPAAHAGVQIATAHVTNVAAPIWDIGTNIKTQGIKFAIELILGGTAIISAGLFFLAKNKTMALKTAAIGVVLAGVFAALPSLGVMSQDTFRDLTNSRGMR